MDSSSECPCSPSTSAEDENSNVEIDAKKSKDGEESRDRFSELPDSIRSSILELLPLREAARTSVLSKCWRRIWTCYRNLDLRTSFLVRERDERFPSLNTKNYVDAVDQILNVHQKSKVDMFRVHFRQFDAYVSHLQQWIDRVAAFSLEVLHITVGNAVVLSVNEKFPYTFSSSDFEARNRLRYLHLQRCNLVVPPPFGGFQFLVTLVLEHSRMADECLGRLFSKCLCLERIELRECEGFTRLKVGSALTKMRYLTVEKCMKLETVEISSDVNLAFFFCHGKFGQIDFSGTSKSAKVDCVPKTGTIFFTLPSFTCQLQELTLRFSYYCEPVRALEGIPTMKHLRLLRLDAYTNGEKDMNWVFLLTNKCPFLEELELDAKVMGPADQSLTHGEMDSFAKRHHHHLRVVSISRVYDHHQCLVDLAVDLLIHAVRLRRMIINRPETGYGRVSQRVRDLLRERAASDVELVFHRMV